MSEKYNNELRYWDKCYNNEKKLRNTWYKKLFLSISGKNYDWFSDKIILDFGSGPRGSLEWCDNAYQRICADILVNEYEKYGINNHKAEYIRTTEDSIPLETSHVDVSFTINSIDHADYPELMLFEIMRVTKINGFIGGSININEPPTISEPNTIKIDFFQNYLVRYMLLERTFLAPKNKGEGGVYKYLMNHMNHGTPLPTIQGEEEACLWFFGKLIDRPL